MICTNMGKGRLVEAFVCLFRWLMMDVVDIKGGGWDKGVEFDLLHG